MLNLLKHAIAPGLVLAVTILISNVFGPTLELIVLLIAPFLCGLLAVYLHSRSSWSTLKVRDGAWLGVTTGGIGALHFLLLAGYCISFFKPLREIKLEEFYLLQKLTSYTVRFF